MQDSYNLINLPTQSTILFPKLGFYKIDASESSFKKHKE